MKSFALVAALLSSAAFSSLAAAQKQTLQFLHDRVARRESMSAPMPSPR
jgi:hypothetical protein